MKLASDKTLRWFSIIFCSVCWAYALLTRFTMFFMAPRLDKAIMLAAAIAIMGLISAFIFHRLLPKIISELLPAAALKRIIPSMLAAAVLLLFIISPLHFPENHSLEIAPFPQPAEGNLTIISIKRIDHPGGDKELVYPSIMDLYGNWKIDPDSYAITWGGDAQAKISYAALMQSGIEILFATGPQQGKAHILWDNLEFNSDLNAPVEGTQIVELVPALDFQRTNLTQKVLVGFAWLAEFLGLSAIIVISGSILQKFSYRNLKTIMICATTFLILIPLVNAADPAVEFQDPNLETAIRRTIHQSKGVIRQHKLLTIAKIDASNIDASKTGIISLEGIQQLRKLESLKLRGNHITDITQLSQLTRLREVDLRDNAIRDISPLANLTKLEYLNLRGNPITDLTPLNQLSAITDLNLDGIPIGEAIGLLENFSNLRRLNLRNCSITDVSVLAKLISQDALRDDPITGTLAQVDIRDNPISRGAKDGYAPLRPFWEQVSERAPYTLPAIRTLKAPNFSHAGGFYEEEFQLTLSAQDPKAEIHYTLDGSEPNLDSPLYSQPLRIQSRIGQPNILSAINTTSPIWKEPLGEVNKASVVRAKAFHPDGSESETVSHTFFVDKNIAGRYSLPIFSLSTDPDNFFDYDQGIYVMGRTWDMAKRIPADVQAHTANYFHKGGQWERPVSIEYFDPSGKRLVAQNGGVRINGAYARSFRQKALRLYADDWYGQTDRFTLEFFPGLKDSVESKPIVNFKTLILRNSGHDQDFSMFKDVMIQTLVKHTSLDTQAYRPVIVFLNGEYWGIHDLQERLDANYLAAHYQVDPNKVVILTGNSRLNTGEAGDEAHYRALLDYIGSHRITDPQVYSYVATQMDIENYIDYLSTEIFIGNGDWPHNNIKYWRYKTDAYHPEAPYGQDGRWRWILFDTEASFDIFADGQIADKHKTLERILFKSEKLEWSVFLMRSLLENSDFRTRFINRFADHLNTTFTPERVISIIDEMQAAIAPEMPEHIRRWRTMEDSMVVWRRNVDKMRTFAQLQPDFVRQHIVDNFGLSGTAMITLLTDSTRGHIRINTLDIQSDTPGVADAENWSGTYFEGVPITLSAIPNPGYQFAGWEGVELSNPDISLTLTESITLRANFIPDEE